MTPGEEQKEKYRRLVLYLLRVYPECAVVGSDDHKEFVDDMSDMLLAALTCRERASTS